MHFSWGQILVGWTLVIIRSISGSVLFALAQHDLKRLLAS
jgi:hypothetical protein